MKKEAPIKRWDEAIPMGNGLMGGLLYGEGSRLKISLDRGDLWDERASPTVSREDFTWQHWLDLRADGKWGEIDELFDKIFEHPTPTKIPGGRLEITLDASQSVTAFSLDPGSAVGRAEFNEGQATLECFFSAVDGVALLRITASGSVGWRFAPPIVLQEKLGYAPPQIQESGDERWFLQASPEGLLWAAVGAQKRVGDDLIIAFTITASSTDGADPLRIGLERVGDALDRGHAALLERHRAWWQDYWAVSRVSVPDPAIQSHYDLVRYFLGASSRTGAPPMPLQGVWTADDGLPPWKGDYHHDLNTQMMYVSYLSAGHLAEGRVFLDFMWQLLPTFRKFARAFYGTPGAMFPSVMSAAGTAMGGWPMFSLMPQGNASWVGWMFHRHWLYTRDETFLKERAYPFCVELGECLAALLQPDAQGMLTMPISSSPEIFNNTPGAYLPPNSNYDHDGMTTLFSGLADMAGALGQPEEATRWADVASRLGERWADPQTRELGFARGIPFDRSHRHFSHLMAIHPYGQLSIEGSDDDRRQITASLAALDRIGTGEWCGYSHTWAACLHARAGAAEAALKHLAIYCDAFISSNGFHLNCNQKGGPGWGAKWDNPRLFTLEGNFLAMEAVHEMLLQGWGGIVRIFPAVPAAWQDVSFRDLRAEGGWKVTAELRVGKVVRLEILSTAGGTLRLKSPWNALTANGNELALGTDGIVELAIQPGDTFVFRAKEVR
jgi:alpha-L-fucosidase 2